MTGLRSQIHAALVDLAEPDDPDTSKLVDAVEAAVRVERTDRRFVRADDPDTTQWMTGYDAALDEVIGAVAKALGVQEREGETHDALRWESASTDEPGDQNASSARRIGPSSTSAYYSLGPTLAAPSEDGERWDVELIQVCHGEPVNSVSLGRYPDQQAAKAAAQQYEHSAAQI